MKKEYWEYLKENDPIHYYEMKGDPVTGQDTSPDFTYMIFVITEIITITLWIAL